MQLVIKSNVKTCVATYIHVYIVAISFVKIFLQYDGEEFRKHKDVKKFTKGIFNLKPFLPKYSKISDIKQLFDYYRSLNNYDLDLKMLTLTLSTIFIILVKVHRQSIL